MNIIAPQLDLQIVVNEQRKELSALRAALAEARRPKTCAGCRRFINEFCVSTKAYSVGPCPPDFGCIHWEPAPGSGQEQ